MYRLIRFGTTNLEYANQEDDVGSGETPTAYRALSDGGAVDGFGSLSKRPAVVERVKRLRLTARTPEELETSYYSLLSLVGRRDKLYRRTPSGRVQFMLARLVDLTASRTYKQAQYRYLQDVELRFACQEPYWHGAQLNGWALDDGYSLDYGEALDGAAPQAVTGVNSHGFVIQVGSAADPGRAPIRDARIRLLPGAATMSVINIYRIGGETLGYIGAVPAGGELSIDSGRMSVECTDNPNAYASLDIAPTADLAAWFALQPGNNQISLSWVGGARSGAQIEVIGREAWY